MARETKYPIEYTKMPKPVEPGFKPDFIFDSHGRLVMPFTREHLLTLKTMPGSKDVKISTEPVLNDPASIKSGYLDLATYLKVGPKGGWIVQLAGGDFPYPISYYNEKTKEMNFYVDKEGNVAATNFSHIDGKIGSTPISTIESGVSRANLGLDVNGFVQKVIQGANITGTPAVGVNVTNQYIGYYNGSTWPVYIANDGKFMFQGDSRNYITWDGSVLRIRGLLNADDIIAGTLTGRTIQTATSGKRVVIHHPSYAGEILLYNSDDTLGLELYGSRITSFSGTGRMDIIANSFGGGGRIEAWDTNQIGSSDVSFKYLRTEFGGKIVTDGPAFDIGEPATRWGNLYLSGNIYINGTVDGVDISAHAANPSAHHTKTAYSSEITVNSNWQMNNYEINNLSYLRFSSTYGQIYWGTARAVDMMNTWDPLPSGTTGWHRWDMRVDMIPCADNAGQIGYDSRRWQKVRAVIITPGDLIFENKFRITEEGENALAIYNPKGKKILIIDDEGNIKKVNT